MHISSCKIYLFLLLNLSTSLNAYAKTVEQQIPDFPIRSQEIYRGEIHFYFGTINPAEKTGLQSELLKLDSIGLTKTTDAHIEIAKAVYVVNLPVGFFDDKELTGFKFLSHVMKPDKLKDKGNGLFEVVHVGKHDYTYEMRSFFDADDISTLPNSKISRSVLAAKKLDVISKSASTIMVTEKTKFSNGWPGSVVVTSFIPIKENKTLVVSYHLSGKKKNSELSEKPEEDYIKEIERIRDLQNTFLKLQD